MLKDDPISTDFYMVFKFLFFFNTNMLFFQISGEEERFKTLSDKSFLELAGKSKRQSVWKFSFCNNLRNIAIKK